MRNLMAEFGRYFLASGVGLLVDFGLLFTLTEYAHFHYLVSASISFLVGLAVVYYLSIKWVFTARRLTSPRAELLVFAVVGVVGLGLNNLGLWLLTELAGLYYLGSKVLVTGGVFLWNFSARKMLLFRIKNELNEIHYVDRG